MGTQNCPAGLVFFLLLTYFPIPQEYNFIPSFSPLKLPTFLALSHMMTSHFMDKIEKSSSLYQTCNLQWGPFSPSLLWLKWKKCPSAYQSPVPSTCTRALIPSNTVLLWLFPLSTLSVPLSMGQAHH